MLQILNLFGCKIEHQGLNLLLEALKFNQTINDLNLGRNLLKGKKSSKLIYSLLLYCNNITHLNISQNDLGSAGVSLILRAICSFLKEDGICKI